MVATIMAAMNSMKKKLHTCAVSKIHLGHNGLLDNCNRDC